MESSFKSESRDQKIAGFCKCPIETGLDGEAPKMKFSKIFKINKIVSIVAFAPDFGIWCLRLMPGGLPQTCSPKIKI